MLSRKVQRTRVESLASTSTKAAVNELALADHNRDTCFVIRLRSPWVSSPRGLLGVVLSGVIRPLIWVISIVTLLITLLINYP